MLAIFLFFFKILIIFSALVIIIVTAGLQIYFLIKSNKILDLSIAYNNSKYSDSQIDFIKDMNEIAKTKSFYGLLATLELIKNEINHKNYFILIIRVLAGLFSYENKKK